MSRETPLAQALKEDIRRRGPISVRDYMARCLTDPNYGYYRRRDALGRTGDFVTAPEISQIFGELIGLWAANIWQQMGAPKPIRLVEIGPGRGTLMRDMLRAARVLPAFLDAVDVHLVEISARLGGLQRQTLTAAPRPIRWHEDCHDIPPGPTIAVANEVLDALPARQLVWHGGRWQARGVSLDAMDRLSFTVVVSDDVPSAATTLLPQPSGEGCIFEIAEFSSLLSPLLARADHAPLAALFIDYGHEDPLALGDTLQAVRDHAYEHPLASPGEADLSMQVNFGQLAEQIRAGAADVAPRSPIMVDGPTTQAQFLGRLGIVERASRLMAANPRAAASIEAGVVRLLAPTGMGSRFKAIGLRSADLPTLPGLAHIDMPDRIT